MDEPRLSPVLRQRLIILAQSYERLTGTPLVAFDADLVSALWHHRSAIVAHDTADDPIFFFGNRVALELFEMDWASFTHLPSRLSAEPLLRPEREALLARVS